MLLEFEKMGADEMFIIPKKIIDEYMPVTNGEYIKVYLYILRNYSEGIETDGIVDALNMLESDVLRAVRFWEDKGVFKVKEEKREPARILKAEPAEAVKKEPEKYEVLEESVKEEDIRDIKNSLNMSKLEGDTGFKMIVFVGQKYLKKIFTQTDIQTLAFLYDEGGLGMSYELLEYLIEICASKNKTSLRYIEATAIEWHKSGVDSVEKAKMVSNIYNSRVWTVLRSFGISDRSPIRQELDYINKWFDEYGFTAQMVERACEKTVEQLTKPSFQYADSILSKWYENEVRTMSQIEDEDKEYKRQQEEKRDKKFKNAVAVKSPNRFHNFSQRTDDLDSDLYERTLKEF